MFWNKKGLEKKIKVLIAEDERVIREYIEKILINDGYEVIGVSRGDEAVKRTEIENPDMIILDIVMEKDNAGLEALQKIKEKYGDKIPIILLTSKDRREDILKGYKYGADYYIPKSDFKKNKETLLKGIHMILSAPIEEREDIAKKYGLI